MEDLYKLISKLDKTYREAHKLSYQVRFHSVSIFSDGSGFLYLDGQLITYFNSPDEMWCGISSYHSSLLQKINVGDSGLSTEKVV